MPRVGAADSGDRTGMSGHCQPIVNGGANSAALDRRLATSMMTGDQQDETMARSDGSFERGIDGGPRIVERVTMQVHDPVGLH